MDELHKLRLVSIYERASGMSLHLRFGAAAHGLTFKQSDYKTKQATTSTVMLHQELRPDTAFSFIVQAVGILDTQAAVFSCLATVFPEVDEATWTDSRVPQFRENVAALWRRLRIAFHAETAQMGQSNDPHYTC